MNSRTFPLSAITLSLCALSGPLLAQGVAPDSGQVLRDLKQSAPQALPASPPLQRIQETEGTSAADARKIFVKTIRITGNQELTTAELMPLVAGLEGQEVPLSRVQAAARRISRYYREKGFPVARAYLPEQDITDGAITIAVMEGRISSHRVTNRSLLSDARVNDYLADVKDGDIVRGAEIDRRLLLLQDTPGVGASRATLQPGASVGTSELLVEVDPSAPYSANAALDNHGSRYTGVYRASGSFTLASPLKIGDQLGFSVLTSGEGLRFGRVAYQMPIGSSGLRVGAAYFDVRYRLGREFAALLAHGTANSTSVYASYPLVRSQSTNLNATLSHEDKKTVDYVDSTATVTRKKVKTNSLGLTGSLQDSMGGGGFNNLELALVSGQLDIQSPAALAIDAASARSHGSYGKFDWSLSRLQRITDQAQVWFILTGQQANKNLDSSEKFSLGGPTSIRAYPTGEASGDEGYRGTVEVRHSLAQSVQGSVFYDFGSVKINKTPFAATANTRRLAGAGFGATAAWDKVQVKASLAWRTSGGAPVSIPASAVKSPTLWLQAGVEF
ncbi:MAG: ShlB/FhaC/HecB family hemolysin secretion/activation protein [Burkholderiaceae bacterium]|nr:ShlB/FhaC/HecB family hemolysin secretion/activation protein [Burkholderiaceae bacterium]